MCKIADAVSFEEGSVLPLAINTAGLGLFGDEHLKLPLPSVDPQLSNNWVFIYGGSTSVGATAIQLAKAAGSKVLTVASKRNHEFCRALGADSVFDYREVDWIEEATVLLKGGDPIAGAFDSISSEATMKTTAEFLARVNSPDSLIITVSPPAETIHGKMTFGTDVTRDDKLARAIWHQYLSRALTKGTFFAKPDPLVTGTGLESVQMAMDIQKKGISARKVVVSIA